MFYAKLFKEFLFVFLYLIICIVFKIHPFFSFFWYFILFLCSIRVHDCMCKDMDHMLITRSVLLIRIAQSCILIH